MRETAQTGSQDEGATDPFVRVLAQLNLSPYSTRMGRLGFLPARANLAPHLIKQLLRFDKMLGPRTLLPYWLLREDVDTETRRMVAQRMIKDSYTNYLPRPSFSHALFQAVDRGLIPPSNDIERLALRLIQMGPPFSLFSTDAVAYFSAGEIAEKMGRTQPDPRREKVWVGVQAKQRLAASEDVAAIAQKDDAWRMVNAGAFPVQTFNSALELSLLGCAPPGTSTIGWLAPPPADITAPWIVPPEWRLYPQAFWDTFCALNAEESAEFLTHLAAGEWMMPFSMSPRPGSILERGIPEPTERDVEVVIHRLDSARTRRAALPFWLLARDLINNSAREWTPLLRPYTRVARKWPSLKVPMDTLFLIQPNQDNGDLWWELGFACAHGKDGSSSDTALAVKLWKGAGVDPFPEIPEYLWNLHPDRDGRAQAENNHFRRITAPSTESAPRVRRGP